MEHLLLHSIGQWLGIFGRLCVLYSGWFGLCRRLQWMLECLLGRFYCNISSKKWNAVSMSIVNNLVRDEQLNF